MGDGRIGGILIARKVLRMNVVVRRISDEDQIHDTGIVMQTESLGS